MRSFLSALLMASVLAGATVVAVGWADESPASAGGSKSDAAWVPVDISAAITSRLSASRVGGA